MSDKTKRFNARRRRVVAPVHLQNDPVMVDELIVYDNAWGPFLNGSCHLTCRDIEKLHRFAAEIGLRRSWFQDKHVRPDLWHYDLTPGMRRRAIEHGAVFVPIMTQARAMVARWDEEKGKG